MISNLLTQGWRFASTLGLKLANAFGVLFNLVPDQRVLRFPQQQRAHDKR